MADRAAVNIKVVICKFQGGSNLEYGMLNDRPENYKGNLQN
jgi:hypothetical protein